MIDPTGMFTLVETSIANSLRSIIANIEINVATNLQNIFSDPDNATKYLLEDIFYSLLIAGASYLLPKLIFSCKNMYINAKFNKILKKIPTSDVSTGANRAVFYCGTENRELARIFALSNDKTLIDFTPGGKALSNMLKDAGLTPAQERALWAMLSKRYAESAVGDVYCFGRGAHPKSIFASVEMPVLDRNPKIWHIWSELFYQK